MLENIVLLMLITIDIIEQLHLILFAFESNHFTFIAEISVHFGLSLRLTVEL